MRELHLRNLIAVVEAGSVRGAARRLGISEAAVSKNLSALERAVGLPLLIRTSRGAEPTEHGRLVLRRARVIDAELRKLDEEVAALAGAGGGGRVAIAVSSTAEALLMPRAVMKFHAARPTVGIAIMSGPPATTVAALREGKVDFAIGPAPPSVQGPDIQAERLISTDMVVVARTGHPLAQCRDLAILARCEWVVGARQAEIDSALEQAFAAHGLAPPTFPVQRDSFNALLHLLLQSDLLAAASKPTVDPFVALGMLVYVPAPLKLPPMVQCLITATSRPLSAPALALSEEFRRASRAHRR